MDKCKPNYPKKYFFATLKFNSDIFKDENPLLVKDLLSNINKCQDNENISFSKESDTAHPPLKLPKYDIQLKTTFPKTYSLKPHSKK